MARDRARFRQPLGNGHSTGMAMDLHTQNVLLDVAKLQQAQDQQDEELREIRSVMNEGFRSLSAKLEQLGAVQAATGRTNWPVLSSIAGVGFTFCTSLVVGAYFLSSQQTQVQISPILSALQSGARDVANIERRLTDYQDWQRETDKDLQVNAQVDADSSRDRADSNRRLDRIADNVNQNTARTTSLFERLCEIETQFQSDERDSLTRDQYQQRWNGIFYRKLFGEEMPSLGPPQPGLAMGKPCSRG